MLNLASQTFLIYGGGEDSLLDGGCHLQVSIYGDADFSDLMIFPSCHSSARISICLLAKIRTKKKQAAMCDPGKRKFTKPPPARLIMGKKKKKGRGGGRRSGQHWPLTSWYWF
jgi:hypothetical protein